MRRGRISVDEARLRPHRRERGQQQQQQQQGEDSRQELDRASASPRWKSSAGDLDYKRMRGLPMIAPGVTGAQQGSNPVGALLAKERRQESRR